MNSIQSPVVPFNGYTSYSSSTSLSVSVRQSTTGAEKQSETTVHLSYQSSRTHTFAPNGVEKYQAIGEGQTTAASNILGFMERQIQRDIADGATPEELASRLQAGLEGFQKGYGEAFEQLQGMGMLADEKVADATFRTYDEVVAGIQGIAEKLGIESPISTEESNVSDGQTADPAGVESVGASSIDVSTKSVSYVRSYDSQFVTPVERDKSEDEGLEPIDRRIVDDFVENQKLAEERQFTASEAGYRSYSFEVKTQDGDVVKIDAYSSFGRGFAENSGGYGYVAENQDYLNFSISGELDEDEMAAINDLLTQVNDVAEVFFGGDVYAAFEKALELGFDESEIARFSLNLSQAEVTRVENAYTNSSNEASRQPLNKVMVLSEFAQKLEVLQKGLEHMGINIEVAEKLFELIEKNVGDKHPHSDKLREMVDRFSNELAPVSKPSLSDD